MNLLRTVLLLLLWAQVSPAFAKGEWSGNIALEARLFPEEALHQGQEQQNLSLAVSPEYYLDWNSE